MNDNGSHGARVKALILTCGIKLWRRDGRVSARAIGRMMGKTHAAILYHYSNAEALQAAVAAEAVRVGDTVIVPQLIASRHPAAAAISDADRARYLAAV